MNLVRQQEPCELQSRIVHERLRAAVEFDRLEQLRVRERLEHLPKARVGRLECRHYILPFLRNRRRAWAARSLAEGVVQPGDPEAALLNEDVRQLPGGLELRMRSELPFVG